MKQVVCVALCIVFLLLLASCKEDWEASGASQQRHGVVSPSGYDLKLIDTVRGVACYGYPGTSASISCVRAVVK
jgi:hypothetical protein